MPKAAIINVGDRFGKWTVLSDVCHTSSNGKTRFHECQCDCGVVKQVCRSAIFAAGRRNGGCPHCWAPKGSRAKDGMKKCSRCSTMKTIEEFHKSIRTSDGLTDYCRSCRKDRGLRKAHGISLSEYTAMQELQGGVCAICSRHGSEFKKGLCVDHDHDTGAIRALLCPNCNTSIGLMQDDANLLVAAADYLRKHSRCLFQNHDQGKAMHSLPDACQTK